MTHDETKQAATQAADDSPKRRGGCLWRAAKYSVAPAVLFVLLLSVAVYRNLLCTPRLKISEETTYLTEPLASDGHSVDYFRAFERKFYPPEMKTDQNGYRLVVRALGDVPNHRWYGTQGGSGVIDTEFAAAQVYEKLGLVRSLKPIMQHAPPRRTVIDYVKRQGLEDGSRYELTDRLAEPWTLDDLPMLESWLVENGPALDLLGDAVRKPAFCMPLIRKNPDTPLSESVVMGQIERVRDFSRSLTARANYRIGTGDVDGAIYDTVTQKYLGRHMQRQSSLVDALVGIAVEQMAGHFGIAAVRESQPSEDQLRRCLAGLRASPLRSDPDQIWFFRRFYALDSAQAMAQGRQSLAERLKAWDADGTYSSDNATARPLDWNVIMRRINAHYDAPGSVSDVLPTLEPSLSDISLGARSRRVAEYLIHCESPPYSAFLEARRRSVCSGNLRRIALAMLLYERQHGTLPPAYTVDAEGFPLHSWRVLLLPYLNEQRLFSQIRLDESWNSRHNRQFHDAAIAVYQCPSAVVTPGETTYSVVVGDQTAFQPGKGRRLDEFGMDLILVVERWKPVCWMDPASELTAAVALEGVKKRPKDRDGIGSEHPGLVVTSLRNGSSRFIPGTIKSPVLQTLLDGTAARWPQ